MARGGEAVVGTAQGVVFVAGALPGEHIQLRDVRRDGGALRGALASVLVAAPERVPPACTFAERCGGCPWMTATVDAQRAWKQRFLSDALGATELSVSMEAAGAPLGYRRRARLVFAGGRSPKLGYRSRRNRIIIDTDECVVLDSVLAAALRSVRTRLLPHLVGEGELHLAVSVPEHRPAAVLVVTSQGAQTTAVYEACARLASLPEFAGIALRAGGAPAPALWGDPREHTIGADGLPLVGPPGGFSQANEAVNAGLVAQVARLAETAGQRVLELYAGHGNLTVALAPGAASLVAVEFDAAGAAACRENVARRGLAHVRVVAGDAAAWESVPVDVVVLDPPRAGAREALDAIVRSRPRRIVYVSCDTATLGRDVARLRALGYVPDAAIALDMFPQTAHLESVVRLVPGSAR
jgi:23S rRNA (uracil1939-C5)-methyltransferase